MPHLVILTGPIAAGKYTVAERLTQRLTGCGHTVVVADVDDVAAIGTLEQMVAAGALRSEVWIAAFAEVPRHLFLRRFFRQSDDLAGWVPVSDTDPGALELIYDGATWVTQLDNDPHRWQAARGAGEPAPGSPTSSSTAPGLMALMLEALDVRDGHRVLEVGTGSGYNAALLCHRLGAGGVVTVEVDRDVAGAARDSLRTAGYTPTVVVADGAAGYPDRSPYDRLIATCSAASVPPAWTTQVRPGGLILTSLHRDLGGGPLVLLQVRGDQAEGRFLPGYGGFMPLRVHPPVDVGRLLDAALAGGGAAATRGGVDRVHPGWRWPTAVAAGRRRLLSLPGRDHRQRVRARRPAAVGGS